MNQKLTPENPQPHPNTRWWKRLTHSHWSLIISGVGVLVALFVGLLVSDTTMRAALVHSQFDTSSGTSTISSQSPSPMSTIGPTNSIVPSTQISASRFRQVDIYTFLNQEDMIPEQHYSVSGGETIQSFAIAQAKVAFIGYYFTIDNANTPVKDTIGSNLQIVIPNHEPGTSILLYIEAVASNNQGSDDKATRSGWIRYILDYVEPQESNTQNADAYIIVTTESSNQEKENGEYAIGSELFVRAYPGNLVKKVVYNWDYETNVYVDGCMAKILIPKSFSSGSIHKLSVIAVYEQGFGTGWQVFDLRIE